MAQATATKSPKFYYGPVQRNLRKSKGKGFQLCLLDLEAGDFRWFDHPSDLRWAIETLISPVGSEREEYRTIELPAKRISAEIPAEDLEDLF
ncbi:MAG: hypothetical protein PHE24_03230, partial [Patescibacteria group bacterium]|nr:hypothetical protein [Patescibacteria group bacterium]